MQIEDAPLLLEMGCLNNFPFLAFRKSLQNNFTFDII
ncbi:hypothetical protein Sp14A_03320 [Streptococcus pluranimalium]|uniref:Uncharacterized protein n=1 Tax=Streptococcus pluranimalium TaxID=82348 RepID=A0A345VHR4_9STRE|nr:hypothetical protein Sp14A_03320 [Streptococcus pluranimalium]